jgi:hypothetical protein
MLWPFPTNSSLSSPSRKGPGDDRCKCSLQLNDAINRLRELRLSHPQLVFSFTCE